MGNYDVCISSVAEIMKQSALRMGASEPKPGQCAGVFNHCAKYGLETIRSALINLERSEDYFPKTAKIYNEVKRIHDLDKKKEVVFDKKSTCKYFDENESEESKYLCKIEIDGVEESISLLSYNMPLCVWHRDVLYAKNNPNSVVSIAVDYAMNHISKIISEKENDKSHKADDHFANVDKMVAIVSGR